MPPSVSVIIATYNRSNVLRHALASVLAQTLADFEVLVVGDACTDDTADVVASLRDPRVRFHNRTTNHGEQSMPNNDGVELARGALIAFLNHDDLWLPEHLERASDELRRNGWHGVCSGRATFDAAGRWWYGGPVAVGPLPPSHFHPFSTWVLTRDALARVGRFRDARRLRFAPSVDWLRRAYRRRVPLGGVPGVSVVVVPSGSRLNSYRDREEQPHREVLSLLAQPDGRERILTSVLLDAHERLEHPQNRDVARAVVRRVDPLMQRFTGSTIGYLRTMIRYRRRGSFLDRLRVRRGLTPLPPLPEDPSDA